MFKNLSEKPIAELQMEQADNWEKEDLLHKCVTTREGQPSFIFYEGPPTANGRPGIHHVIARTLKDSVCRYKTMQGFKVKRKAGWDTHGLPVEIEVEKQLKMSGKKDIETYGIKEFNEKCRESVFTYEGMWREMTKRMGYLIDLDNPYITLDNNFIETGWWILKEFFKAGLIYEGHKILPYCPRCGTGLASHEVAQGYKEVKVTTITAKFKRKDADEYFLAWTTTPWTLASNVSLTVGPDVDYVKVKMTAGEEEGNIFYVAKVLADKVLGAENYEILQEMKGKELEYVEYEQLMPFVKPDKKAFFVTCADYVTIEDGTGIVHTAPAFGEDDYQTGRRYNLPVVNPVDEEGKYTETPWKGRFVMEDGLDIDIIKWLAGENKIFAKEKIVHNYPHCWRCGTPLVYYAKPSWYIEMSKLKDQLVANNNTVNWFPDFVGEKRFGNWLEEVKDWAISRNRYWGTPIPIWRCECGHLECIGSRAELVEKAQEDIDESIELHRPYVDDVHLTCPECGKTMSRIPEVMDCWFDSGSMPFAQQHYPFENKENFDEELFPADFICEGIDQTRILNVFNHIPAQLAKDNKKFQISKVASGARFRDYRGCVEWLDDAGMVNICYCLNFPELPLQGNYDDTKYKIYFADSGLLVAMLDEEAQEDLRTNKNLGVYKGALYENVVGEALVKAGYKLYYYKRDDSTLEQDFFVRTASALIPIEVKAKNGTAKSMRTLISSEKYADIHCGIKFTGGNIGYSDDIYTFPYFCAFLLKRYLAGADI